MFVRPRLFVLPLAAALIAAICVWKVTRPPQKQAIPRDSGSGSLAAPDFELPDQGRDLQVGSHRQTDPSRRVRLKSYLGRHTILLAFFDGDVGADQEPLLIRLRDRHQRLEEMGVVALAVTTALPQRNRRAIERGGAFPFPLLSDLDGSVVAEWGCLDVLDDGSRRTRPALFLIDRAGNVSWSDRAPKPEAAPFRTIESLLSEG